MSTASGDSERKVNSGGEEGKTILVASITFLCHVVFSEENDTDLETDRLLGQQRTDDQGFYDDKVSVHLFQVKLSLV